jgi:SPP1 family predicted phage head-tail adaptor
MLGNTNRVRLTIEQRTGVEDGFGDAPDVWESVRVEWFVLLPNAQGEYTEGDQIKSRTTFNAECPYFAGANSEMRLVNGDRVYTVDSVVNRDNRNRTLDWVLVQVNG